MYKCIACSECFTNRVDAFRHLETSDDDAHSRCRFAEGENGRARPEHPEVSPQSAPTVRAGLGAEAIAVAAATEHLDPVAAYRAQQQQRREETAYSSFYAAAKMGHLDACMRHLAAGVNPNTAHDDGFTPLMTAAEAGHGAVVKLIGDHSACDPTVRNAYGQTALHFAAQNGKAAAAINLLDSATGRAASKMLLNATSGGCTAAEKARLAGFSALANELAARATELHIAQITDELTGASASLRWVRCADGVHPAATSTLPDSTLQRSSLDPSDELDPGTYAVLADALMVKQTFTKDEMAALGIDRTAIRPSSYIKVGPRGDCYTPVSAPCGSFDSLRARLGALCEALNVQLHDSRPGAMHGRFDDDDEGFIGIDDGQPTCCICLSETVDTAFTPCFHASFCSGCAASLLAKRAACPIGRCNIKGVQRIYL